MFVNVNYIRNGNRKIVLSEIRLPRKQALRWIPALGRGLSSVLRVIPVRGWVGQDWEEGEIEPHCSDNTGLSQSYREFWIWDWTSKSFQSEARNSGLWTPHQQVTGSEPSWRPKKGRDSDEQLPSAEGDGWRRTQLWPICRHFPCTWENECLDPEGRNRSHPPKKKKSSQKLKYISEKNLNSKKWRTCIKLFINEQQIKHNI